MTKLEELEAAVADAAADADDAYAAYWDARDYRATVVAIDAWVVYAAALKAAWAALDAYQAEPEKTQEENSND